MVKEVSLRKNDKTKVEEWKEGKNDLYLHPYITEMLMNQPQTTLSVVFILYKTTHNITYKITYNISYGLSQFEP